MKAQKISINQSSGRCVWHTAATPADLSRRTNSFKEAPKHQPIRRAPWCGSTATVHKCWILSWITESFQIVNYMNVTWPDVCSHCAPMRYSDADVKTDQNSWVGSCAWLYIFRVGEWRMDMWKLFTSCMVFVTLTLSQHIRMRDPSWCFTPHWTTSFLWAHQTKNTIHVFIYCTFQNITQPQRNEIFSFIWTVPYRKNVIWRHFTCRLMSCHLSCTHNCTVFATVLLFYFILFSCGYML